MDKPEIRIRKQDGLYYAEIVIGSEVVWTSGRYIRVRNAAESAATTSYFKGDKK